MRKSPAIASILLCMGVISSHSSALAMPSEKDDAPKVYIDCPSCDHDYIRTEINFVNYVRDRKDADIHVLVTTQRTGAGGREYTIAFIGLKAYQDFKNILKYVSGATDTEQEVRKGLAKVLKMGLVAAAARTSIASSIDVSFKEKASTSPTDVDDKWNFWVFNLGVNSFMMGEKSTKFSNFSGNVSANRVTLESKLRLGINADWDEQKFSYGEDTITSTAESRSFSGMYVKSLSEHWSLGGWVDVVHSTFSNIDTSITPSPAIEFNVYPYSMSTRRQLRFLYRLNWSYVNYIQETIYEKSEETLWSHSLTTTLSLIEPWGTITTSVAGSHYFHDPTKYNVNVFGRLSIRIVKGLRANVFGSYGRIHDQLNLAKGSLSIDEVLLRRKELETNYNYFVSFGLSYSFGSIFSNVVNPRFGSGGRGIMRFF
jgi:hypothetical protein